MTHSLKSVRLTPLLVILVLLLAACETGSPPVAQVIPATPAATATALPSPGPTATATVTPLPTHTPLPTATPTNTPSPTATVTPSPTPTPDPYAGLTIAGLASRTYGGGQLQIEETMGVTQAFTRSLVSYPSEGLTLYGFMNVPAGPGPFPVAIVMHGYIDPANYNTIAYTTRYADALARAGYLVIHPNYRNWPLSDEGPELFRASHAIDALNLVSIVRAQAGQPGPLANADAGFIGMMGHSMGGGITLRAITASGAIDAAVLYGSMSGDEQQNFEKILLWSGGERGQEELNTSAADLERIGAIFHLDRINTPVSIHHGDNDGTVPLAWSLDLCDRLQALEKSVECFTYPGQPHTFQGEGDQLFIQRMIEFFDRHKG